MMLRASIELEGNTADLKGLTDTKHTDGVSGVPGSDALIAFSDAFMADDETQLASARDRLAAELGEKAVVDAAGVASNFQRMVRIADGIGIPLDAPMNGASVDLREQLGINEYAAAANTKELPLFKRLVMNTFGRRIFQTIVRRSSRS
jgi:hypothetical protein